MGNHCYLHVKRKAQYFSALPGRPCAIPVLWRPTLSSWYSGPLTGMAEVSVCVCVYTCIHMLREDRVRHGLQSRKEVAGRYLGLPHIPGSPA